MLEENGKNDGIRLKEAQDKQFRQMNRINDFHARLMKIISRREYLERADREYASFLIRQRRFWKAGLFLDSISLAPWVN